MVTVVCDAAAGGQAQWMMSQHIEDVSAEEMARRAAAFFNR